MDTQTSHQPMIASVIEETASVQPVRASSRDYGFDFNAEEIAREMLAPLPIQHSSQAVSQADIDEFEQVFSCFLL
jgi:hypothetical protein